MRDPVIPSEARNRFSIPIKSRSLVAALLGMTVCVIPSAARNLLVHNCEKQIPRRCAPRDDTRYSGGLIGSTFPTAAVTFARTSGSRVAISSFS